MSDKVKAYRKDGSMSLNPINIIPRDIHEVLKVLGLESIVTPDCKFTEDCDIEQMDKIRGPRLEVRANDNRNTPSLIRWGDNGFVIKCFEKPETVLSGGIEPRAFALKLPRLKPLYQRREGPMVHDEGAKAFIKSLAEAQTEQSLEIVTSASLHHINVVALVAYGSINFPLKLTDTESLNILLPFMLLEWIDEALPIHRYVAKAAQQGSMGFQEFLELIQQVVDGLSYIHSKKLIHWDFKGDNCLVTKDGKVKISDFGSANFVAVGPSTVRSSQIRKTTSWNLPKKGFTVDSDSSLSGAVHIIVPEGFSIDSPWWDLYCLGRMIGRILAFEQTKDKSYDDIDWNKIAVKLFSKGPEKGRFERSFMLRIWSRLVREPGSLELIPEMYYQDALHLKRDLAKIEYRFGDANGIEDLFAFPQHVLRIPLDGSVNLSSELKGLLKLGLLRNLTKHLQLNYSLYVFPGATHTRFEHSLGVFASTLGYVRALYSDLLNPDFRLLCDKEDIRAVLFGALLHDIGHGAFSHYLEEIPALIQGATHVQYLEALLRNEQELYTPGMGLPEQTVLSHDEKSEWDTMRSKLIEAAKVLGFKGEVAEKFLILVADILKPKYSDGWGDIRVLDLADRDTSRLVKLYVLHSIVDGGLDADKFDYLQRDSDRANVSYARGIDRERYFQALTTVTFNPTEESNPPPTFSPTIAITRKGIQAVEHLIQSRYQLFNVLYYHPVGRAATVTFLYLVWKFLCPSDESKEERDSRGDRLRLMLFKFRILGDMQAVQWLREQEMTREVNRDPSKESARRINKMFDMLENRDLLPKPVFDGSLRDLMSMKYSQSNGTQQKREGLESKLHRILVIHESRISEVSGLDGYSRYRTAITKLVCENAKKSLKNMLPQEEQEVLDQLHLNEETVFLDLPRAFKDQLENIWVVEKRSEAYWKPAAAHQMELTEGTEDAVDPPPLKPTELDLFAAPLDDVSPSFQATKPASKQSLKDLGTKLSKQSLDFYLRRIRIFLDREQRDLLRNILTDHSKIAGAFFEALINAYTELEEQHVDTGSS